MPTRFGNVALLRTRGIDDDSTPTDRLIGLCLAGHEQAAYALVADHPDVLRAVTRADAEEFVRAAARGNVDQLRLLLACGFAPDAVGESGATALQQAAWRGHVAVVELLLEHGASTQMQDDLYGETALEWARHGASHAESAETCLKAARLIEQAAP
jgi:ankyrin repeat protein